MNTLSATFAPPLEALLRPIPGTDPGGAWLRYTDTYDAIREARRADDPSLPQGIWKHELKKADWGLVSRLCEEAIETRSKDLYLTVWMIEGWVHEYGLAGLTAGLKLLSGLSVDMWAELYPRVDETDPEVRSAPFEWLNQRIPIVIGSLRVTEPDDQDAAPFTWAEVVAARAPGPAGRSPKAAANGAEGRGAAAVQRSIALTPATWLTALSSQVDESISATEELAGVLMARMPDAPPSVRRIGDTLGAVQRWVGALVDSAAPQTRAERDPPAALPEVRTGTPTGETPMPGARDGAVQSREEAYHLLSIAAEYLLRTEPHSPTPYLVQRAVGWGKMPLAQLLEEYSQDGNDLRMLRLLLGLSENG